MKRFSGEPSRQQPERRERGSAYVITLMVILVLTFLGLTLSLVTTTEMQLGTNERIIQRTFYAADTGLNYGTARLLTTKLCDGAVLPVTDQPGVVDEDAEESGDRMRHSKSNVILGAALPILSGPAAYSEINAVGTYNTKAAFRSVVGIVARGQRLVAAESGAVNTVTAGHSAATMIDVQPFEPPTSCYDPLGHMTVDKFLFGDVCPQCGNPDNESTILQKAW
jgi:hypothetical protein